MSFEDFILVLFFLGLISNLGVIMTLLLTDVSFKNTWLLKKWLSILFSEDDDLTNVLVFVDGFEFVLEGCILSFLHHKLIPYL
jgi:hypothetical protein